jgi:hypothetical protein
VNRHNESTVDLVVLSRDSSPLHPQVQQGIAAQKNVQVFVHRVIGKQLPGDENRWSVIARGRNEGKRRGNSPWLMFLDDDVVLAPDCMRQLFDGLRERPEFGALAADYLGESRGRMCAPHVAMGAALFRRAALDQIQFRWMEGRCECHCCCRDLRRRRIGIGYLPTAKATHIALGNSDRHLPAEPENSQSFASKCSAEDRGNRGPYILTAFDRRHARKFQHRFIGSLRAAGNTETVLAFASGLYPSERRKLGQLRGVRLIPLASNGVHIACRRLFAFQGPLSQLPSDSVVAYWDAGDVIFQDRLTELWSFVRANPQRILIAAEPAGHPDNKAVAIWIRCIIDRDARRQAMELMATRPFLNSGFVAGTAGTMLGYLKAADSLLHSQALRGVKSWGDQMAANLYCHRDANRYLAVDDRWNYCLFARKPGDVRLLPSGEFVRRDGRSISVVHGNGGTFRPYAWHAPNALARASRTRKTLV